MKLTGKCKEDFEKWFDIIFYEDYYQIDEYGNVRSKDRVVRCGYGKTRKVKGRVLKPYLNKKNGYLYIDFNIHGSRVKYTIHKLVATQFHGINEDIVLEVNHKDCNKLNNHADNLEWVTRSENTQHAYDNGLISTEGRGGYRHGKKKEV